MAAGVCGVGWYGTETRLSGSKQEDARARIKRTRRRRSNSVYDDVSALHDAQWYSLRRLLPRRLMLASQGLPGCRQTRGLVHYAGWAGLGGGLARRPGQHPASKLRQSSWVGHGAAAPEPQQHCCGRRGAAQGSRGEGNTLLQQVHGYCGFMSQNPAGPAQAPAVQRHAASDGAPNCSPITAVRTCRVGR